MNKPAVAEPLSQVQTGRSIDLHAFCSKDASRQNIGKPFSRGGYTWATNGHVMLRVVERPDIPDEKGARDVIKVFDEYFKGERLRPVMLGTLPKLLVSERECGDCEGSGHQHECPVCSCVCEECNGTGILNISSDDNVSLSIGDASAILNFQ